MLVAAGAGGAAAVDRWGSDGATAGGRCGITGMCGTAAGADDCCAEVAGQKKQVDGPKTAGDCDATPRPN